METPRRFGASAGFRSWCGFVWLRRTDEVSTREIVDEVVDANMGTSQRLVCTWEKQCTTNFRILVPDWIVTVPLISEHCTSNGEPPFSLAQPCPRRNVTNVPDVYVVGRYQFAAHVSWRTSPCRRLRCALASRSLPPATTLQLHNFEEWKMRVYYLFSGDSGPEAVRQVNCWTPPWKLRAAWTLHQADTWLVPLKIFRFRLLMPCGILYVSHSNNVGSRD